MTYSHRRAMAEAIAVFLIIIAGWWALRPQAPTTGHYRLDHAAIVYDGQALKGKFSGQGTLRFKNGDHYRGAFKEGRFDGHGVFTSHSGWRYTGQFKAGVMSGRGKLTTKTKTYEGTFKDGVFQQTHKAAD